MPFKGALCPDTMTEIFLPVIYPYPLRIKVTISVLVLVYSNKTDLHGINKDSFIYNLTVFPERMVLRVVRVISVESEAPTE